MKLKLIVVPGPSGYYLAELTERLGLRESRPMLTSLLQIMPSTWTTLSNQRWPQSSILYSCRLSLSQS
jgi:hypothetical protein